jgi:hypothetical protein
MLWLKQLARPFPTTTDRIIYLATAWNFDSSTLDFLKLFPKDEVFENEDDFMVRCEELKLMIREEQNMPAESLRSPQD